MKAITYSSKSIYLLIALSGFATLAWEVIWQIKSTLALGMSAEGTAITLAAVMGGLSLGALLMGKVLSKNASVKAIRIYAVLEITAGLAGLLLNSAFHILEKLDTWMYNGMPSSVSLVFICGIITVVGIPTLCMGATLPVFGLIAKQLETSIAKLYGLNTLGAAASALVVAFFIIPLFGVTHTIWIIASINIAVGVFALLLTDGKDGARHVPGTAFPVPGTCLAPSVVIFVTGFATFTLEVAWFRSLASVFPNTSDLFAILLACMLIALGIAAKKLPKLKQKNKLLGTQMSLAGVLILLVTPLIERVDNLFSFYKQATHTMPSAGFPLGIDPNTFIVNGIGIAGYVFQILIASCLIGLLIIPPMIFLGVALPWILEEQASSQKMGKLYALNTLAAIAGSLGAAWLLLPIIGFAKTAWLAGILVIAAGILISPVIKRLVWGTLGIIALLIAVYFETGVGKTHVQGYSATDEDGKPAKVLEFYEGPDSTTSAVEYNDGTRALLINSALAAWESGRIYRASAHYMAWMGHLPMILHPDPKKALVICFGTGQTANAVRKENPQELDIVDINKNVFKLAHNFRANEKVLNDPRVKAIVMDGRAYLRRTKKVYDVITLEPMPPVTTGGNALYSKEFYQLARNKLSSNGVIAQWVPFHGAAPHYIASIAKTFIDVFPNAIMWIDHDSKTGILVGSKDNSTAIGKTWPGLLRKVTRNLSNEDIQNAVALNTTQLKQYGNYGEIITDDNQLLAYGKALYVPGMLAASFEILKRINNKIEIPQITPSYR